MHRLRVLTQNRLNIIAPIRCFCDGKTKNEADAKDDPNHPVTRTGRLLKRDLTNVKNFLFRERKVIGTSEQDIRDIRTRANDSEFQTHCDILIIGGGGVGASIAYWLKKRARHGLNVVVLEKDPTYQSASTTLSVGGLRQQFSLEENIQMSLYAAEFMKDIKEHLDDDVELNFTPHGYLMMASEAGADALSQNSELQNRMGAKNELLTAKQLNRKFPWLNTDGVALGCHGLEKEGWFDPWALLMGFKRTASRLGAHFVHGEVVSFEFEQNRDIQVAGVEPGTYEALNRVMVKMENGEVRPIGFSQVIIAAGAHSGSVAKLAKIGKSDGMRSIPLPVEPRKRYVYVFESQGVNCPGLNTPLVIDPSHVYFRRDGVGGNFIGGRSPDPGNEPATDNLDVDYDYFDNEVWPRLAARVPAFESVKVKSAWSGFYEFNTFDENGIIGPHPYYHNLIIATGFSGHGIQQTPAIGRAVSELILDGCFRTIDLTRLCFDRIIVDEPMYERNCV
ncbi:FAD-dependent oxidoreductase domain-containing protein 1-like [Bradysia coprophila]|uniref:FAD-dependent oxidoreductase domain-containing protein 1-like n=1 Tax=Bradysia coprophila TaxID=38358 RepID=UPI00187DA6B5|nr:FAD-dependent oxidoreductase domain-containing protein 1-like [Bradysia coprophila]